MKRIIKRLSLFILVVLSLTIIYPTNTNALSQQTSYININDTTKSLTVGNLSFSNITFKDYSSTSTLSFGLTGVVANSSGKTIDYTSTAYYYDSNYNLIAQGYNSGTAIAGTSNFNQMSNLSILNGHSINDIYYYRLEINTTSSSSTESYSLSTTPSKNNQYSSYDYVIDKYDINIIVNENNTLDITETITAYFNVAKHGIFKTIPLKNTIVRLDGTISKNRTQVTNLSVDNEYTTSRENGNYKIQIGSASRTLTGEQTYVIKYTYNLGKDPIKDYDELYYNIIGNEWDTVIGNVTFTITMPKDFDSSKLGFSSGETGSTNNSKVKYNVSKNKITGSYNGILGVREALTIRCELDEGYFTGAGLSINVMNYLVFLLPIIFLIVSTLIWYKFGRDEKVVETVEFYPPEGFNSLEVGFLYKGKANYQDVTSLLIYLANKGYIEISDGQIDLNSKKVSLSEDSINTANKKIIELQNKIKEERMINPDSKKIKYYENMLDIYKNIDIPIKYEKYGLKSSIKKSNKKNKFIIKKLKNYDGTNINEQWFMQGLFEYNRTEVTDRMLYNSFYVTNDRILQNINKKQNIDQIFEKSASNKKFLIILMIIVTYCLITIPPILTYGQAATLVLALLFPGIGFTLMFSMLFGGKQTIYVNGRATNSSIVTKIFSLLCGGMFGGMPWAFVVLPTLLQDPIYLIGYIVGLVCVLGMVICLKYLPKRTQYGNEILGKLRGFKNFLETAEKDKLESLVMQNPNYFYDILPYTYVLDVSDTWIKKFETISLQAPSWYDSPDTFNTTSFEKFMNTTMVSAQSAMSSSPSSDSSSGGESSGGGSSGGGSGGGGGGSW